MREALRLEPPGASVHFCYALSSHEMRFASQCGVTGLNSLHSNRNPSRLASQRNKLLKRDTKWPVSSRIIVFSASCADYLSVIAPPYDAPGKKGVKHNTAARELCDAAQ